MEGKFKLKKQVSSKKFGIVFPADVELNGFIDAKLNIYAEHPKRSNVWIMVKKKNIYDPKWNWKKETCLN